MRRRVPRTLHASIATSGVVSIARRISRRYETNVRRSCRKSFPNRFHVFSAATRRVSRSEHPSAARYAESPPGEIQSVANRSADSVIFPHRISEESRHLGKSVLQQQANRILCKYGNDGVLSPKHRFNPRATLYSPPPSLTSRKAALSNAYRPGRTQHRLRPKLTRSQRHESFCLIVKDI